MKSKSYDEIVGFLVGVEHFEQVKNLVIYAVGCATPQSAGQSQLEPLLY